MPIQAWPTSISFLSHQLGLDTPAILRLIPYAGDQSDNVVFPGREHRYIGGSDLGHPIHLILPGADLGSQLDRCPRFQSVNLAEVTVDTPIMPGNGHITFPNAGVFKMPYTVTQGGIIGTLIDLHIHTNGRDLQRADIAPRIIQIGRNQGKVALITSRAGVARICVARYGMNVSY